MGSTESNPSSGQASESIYDKYSAEKYCAKSSDLEESDIMEFKSIGQTPKDPMGKFNFFENTVVRRNQNVGNRGKHRNRDIC